MSDFYSSFERRLDRTNLYVLGVAVAAVLVLDSIRGGLSVAAGGAISYVNFQWLKQAVGYVIEVGGRGPVKRHVGLKYAARYALIALALFVTIRFTLLDVTLLLAGLFSYVLAVFLECIYEIVRSLTGTDPNGRTRT